MSITYISSQTNTFVGVIRSIPIKIRGDFLDPINSLLIFKKPVGLSEPSFGHQISGFNCYLEVSLPIIALDHGQAQPLSGPESFQASCPATSHTRIIQGPRRDTLLQLGPPSLPGQMYATPIREHHNLNLV